MMFPLACGLQVWRSPVTGMGGGLQGWPPLDSSSAKAAAVAYGAPVSGCRYLAGSPADEKSCLVSRALEVRAGGMPSCSSCSIRSDQCTCRDCIGWEFIHKVYTWVHVTGRGG